MVQLLGLHACIAGGTGLIPGQGTKILYPASRSGGGGGVRSGEIKCLPSWDSNADPSSVIRVCARCQGHADCTRADLCGVFFPNLEKMYP